MMNNGKVNLVSQNSTSGAMMGDVREYPLSEMELGMYLEQKFEPASVSYNLNRGILIEGADPGKIRKAIRETVSAHEALHSRYAERNGTVCRVLTDGILDIPDGEEMDRDAFAAMLEDPGMPFDLETGVPLRFTLHPIREGGFGLHMQIHHIAVDGTGIGLFMNELYARLRDEAVPADAPDLSDLMIRVRAQDDGEAKEHESAALAFYDRMFEGGVPECNLPVYGPRQRIHPLTDTVLRVTLDREETSALKAAAQRFDVTVFELLLSVYGAILGQYSACEDMTVSIPVNTRDRFSADMIGMFVNSVPVRIRPKRSAALKDYIAETSQTVRAATRTYRLPFEVLTNRFCPERDDSGNPLFDISINYLRQQEGLRDGQLSLELREGMQQMHRDLGLVIRRSDDSVQIMMQYPSAMFEADVMENFLEQYVSGLHRVAGGNADLVRDLTTLPERQTAQLEQFATTEQADLPFTLVHRMFEAQADMYPDRKALIACDGELTYAEMENQADRIANALIAKGVGRGDMVVVLLPRRSYYFTTAIGIMKAGAAFIPCDPQYPTERICLITEDSGARYIVTTGDRIGQYAAGKAIDIKELLACDNATRPHTEMTPEDLVYAIYTSGSTGRPKGVQIRHIGVCNYFTDTPSNILYHQVMETGVENILSITTVSFDLSIKDTFGMLCNGKTLIFANEDQMNDPIAITTLITKHDIHLFNGTPSRLQQYMEYAPFTDCLKQLKMIVCGGELYPTSLMKHLQTLTDAILINTYGPTEITISSNMANLTNADSVSVGRPLLNVREYIVDPDGSPVPRGVIGELYIGGPGVARGYNNLEKQTKERFVEYRGGRCYRSGDFARWDAQGNVEILGRMDNQVKLRGLRIELGEIEEVMAAQPGIRKAVAAVRSLNGQEQLCAWYTAEDEIDVRALRDALKQRLTAYMVPAVFTRVDVIPVNANGKTDIKALPEPVFVHEKVTPPQNETQQRIFDIVAEVVGNANFGIETELYAAGLTSINSVSLSIRLSDAFSVNVQIRDFREQDTVEKLEKHILSLNTEEDFPILGEYPITKTQEGIFFETQTHPGTTIYNMPHLTALNEAIDPERLKGAVVAAVAAHPYLKTRFFLDEQGRIRQKRMDSEPFTEADIQEICCDSIDAVKDTLTSPFDLLSDRLFRVSIIRTGEKDYLFLDTHHIVFDGKARGILMQDISRAYAGEELTPEKYSGYEAALLEERLRTGVHYDRARNYYTELLSGCEPDCMPIPDTQDSSVSGSDTVILEDIDTAAAADFCSRNGISANAFYTAAFGYLLARTCAREDAVFTTVNNGRNDPRFLNSISMFVRTYPVLCKISALTIPDYIREVSRQLVDSLTYDVYSFEEISRELKISPDVLFVYQGQAGGDDGLFCGFSCERIPLELNEAKSGIELQVHPRNDGRTVTCHCSYRKALYTEAFIRNFLEVYAHILSEFARKEDPAEICLLSRQHQERLDGFNRTEKDYGTDQTLIDIFREKASEHAGLTAVIYGERTYTYREVDNLTDRIAAALIRKGIGREDVVSVLIGRSEYMPIVSIGVLKSGAGYQPLDPSYPEERLGFMVQDAAAKLLIADRNLTDRLSGWNGDLLLTDEIPTLPEVTAEEKERLLAAAPKPEDLFILLYTSGSTGTPKGAVLEHRNIAAFCHWFNDAYEMDENACTAAYASYGFDANMMDMYPVLTAGGRLLIIPENIRLDLNRLNTVFTEQKVTHSFMTTQVGRQFAQVCNSPYLRYLSVGGEALVPVAPPKGFLLSNVYGPTECTVLVTRQQIKEMHKRVPIGKPLNNVKLYVVDQQMHRLPAGIPGELCISGPQVCRGYLNRPEKTAEVFLKNPFEMAGNYERIYRTGDTVRLLPDGTVDFVGRNDGQVKIRGFRIELTEVEEIIRRFDGITDATVVSFDAPAGGKELAAYLVAGSAVDTEALKAFIRSEKPPYMVPAVIMQIDSIPLNQNQKVNKRALPKPVLSAAPEQEKKNGALTECEKLLLTILKDTTGIITTDVTSELIGLGLTSISAISFVTVTEKKLGVDYPVTKLLQGASIMDIENEAMRYFLSGKAKGEKASGKQTADMEIRDEYPLTQTQLGVYYETMQHPESTLYNVPFCLKFEGINAGRLRDALCAAVRAHAYLNTHITTGRDGFMQVRNDAVEPEVPVNELGDRDIREVFRTFIRPFTLHKGPLYRFGIFTTQERVWLLMDFHHIVFDGFSVNLFMNSVKDAYENGSAETEGYTYFDYSLDEEKLRQSDEYAKAEGYFRDLLSDFENATEIPADISGKAENGKAASVCEFMERDAVESFCKANRITPSTLFLSSAFYTVSRFASSKDVYLSTISNGRANSKTRGAVGMFVRTLPVAIRPKDGMSVADYITAAGDSMNGSIANEIYPFTEIAGKYGYTTDIMYECQLGVIPDITVGGRTAGSIPQETGTLKFKLKIVIADSPEGIRLSVGYNDALYSEKYMQLLARSLRICTERMMAEPSAEVRHLSLLTEEDVEKLEHFSRTEHGPVPAGGLVHRMFEERAAACPDRTAVIACDGQLTYGQLNRQANIIANNLMMRGVRKDDMIVLLLPRRSYYFAAVLGVLKTGAAFIPCDPQYPAERISLITEDSGAQYIVTTGDKLDQYESGKAIDITDLFEGDRADDPKIEMSPEDLVYAIYTSGSTGKPKGVLIRHIGVCNYFADARANILYSKMAELNVENVLCITTVSFDMSMKDGLGILCNGRTLIFADEEQMNDPMAIAALMEQYNVELFSSTPSRIIQYLDYAPFAEQIRKQKIVICGAEMYPVSLLKTLQGMTRAELFNSYGPTEITISANMAHLTHADHISVGKPLYNYTEFIVDTDDNLLPPGVTGELYVGGPGVAKGYKNLDELTRKQFTEYSGLRIYRTGDYARWDEEGNVIILGRKDNQVKLRGLRIELGEIETLITQQPDVKQALVLIRKLNGQDTLCAYYTASRKIDAVTLRDALKQKLTHYMVPTAYLQLDIFPVNANGKTDRKALPEPVPVRNGEFIEAADKVERFFCDLFAKALKVDRVGAEDDFFEYGGSSLTVTSIVVEAVEAGYQLSYSDVFSHTTPRSLAAFVNGPASGDGDSEIEDFDYSAINNILKRNTLCSFRNGEQRELGNILLTGATGFMGIHVLYHFLRNETGKVYCLLRKGRFSSAQRRLKNMMFYYFGDEGIEGFDDRVEACNGDVTGYESFEQFEQYDISTVFNCAANVKHFSAGTDIEDTNIGGVDNCIAFCRKKNIRLIHFSTVSTAGEYRTHAGETAVPVYTERTLYVGQVLNNKYAHSKFIAERNVLTAISEGLDAKIIRVGTLAPRNRDGEFQINYLTNSFMGRLRTYALVGAFPYSMSQNIIRMGAIDLSAIAFLKLAKTPRECCVFNACNNHSIYLSDIIACMRRRGSHIRFVEKDEFNAEMMKAAEDPAKAAIISSLLAYAHAVPDDTLKPVSMSCTYTNEILYRMDFMWDITDEQYVERFLSALEGLGYFDASNLVR